MRCRFNEKMLSRYADDSLPEELAAPIRAHLETCPDCRARVEAFARVRSSVKPLADVELPAGIDERFMSALDKIIYEKEAREAAHEGGLDRVREFLGEVITSARPALARVAASAFVAACAFFTFLLMTEQGTPVIMGVSGEAFIMKAKGGDWQVLPAGTVLRKGDSIKTGESSTIDLGLKGKYDLRVKSGTVIKLASLTPKYRKGKAEFDISGGDLLVDIGKGFKGSNFSVKTRSAEVKALGTKFMVADIGGMGVSGMGRTWIGVVEGTVGVARNLGYQRLAREAAQWVPVPSGMKLEVVEGMPIPKPAPLVQEEWKKLSELYMLGEKVRVALMISSAKTRVMELLEPCILYVTDERPYVIPRQLEEALYLMAQAIENNDDKPTHEKAASMIEDIITKNPQADFAPQLMLFLGSYYNYLDQTDKALDIFKRTAENYPKTIYASIADCARAVICEMVVGDNQKALGLYKQVIQKYPDSPEAEFSKDRISDLS